MEYIRRLFLGNKGFSLAELVIYLGILGLSVGVFTSVLDTVTKTQVEQSTQNEISGQLTFSMQTIQRLIKTSSVIDLEAGVATSTLVLQMPQEAISPTTIYLQDGTIYLTQGENAPVQALTSDAVTVDSLEFRKSSQPGAKDVVQIDLAISQFEPSQGDMVTRSLRSAVSRVSAVTFDSHLLPPTDGQYDVGSATLRWRDGYFSGKITPVEICLGAECKSSWGAISGVSGSGSPNYLAKWQTSGSITSSIIIDTGSRVGIGVLNPSARVHIANDTTSIPALLIKGATSQTGDVVQIIQNSGSTAGAHFTSQGNNVKFQLKSTGDGSTQIELNPGSTSYFVNGQVGIGTASPDTNYKLTLSGGGIKSENTSSQPAGYFSSTGGGKAIQTGSGSILFGSLAGSGSRTLVVDATGLVSATTTSSGTISGSGASGYLPVWSGSTSLATSTVYETGGNVGIGTTNPQAKLDIYGSLDQIRVTHSSSPTFYTTYTTNGLDARGTGQIYKFSIEGSEKVRIDNTGNVGIGTTSPQSKLQVGGVAGGNSHYITIGKGWDSDSGIKWLRDTFVDASIHQDADEDLVYEVDMTGNLGGSHIFKISSSEKLRITDAGRVGIGNSSPAYKLDVTGDARFTQPVLVGTPTLDGHATTKSYVDSAVSSGVGSGVSGTTNYISKFTSPNAVGNSSIYETGGNIGIGTTGATNKLTVSGDTGLRIIRTSNSDQVLTLTGGDGSGNAGIVASYSLLLNANKDAGLGGNINFQSAGSSKMYIASSGNVGIGTTAPAQLLHVAGTARIDSTLYLNNNAHYINAGEFYVNRTTAQGGFTFNNVGVGELIFKTSNTERARIDSTGNVGIGDTTPSYKLDVTGTGQFTQPVIVGSPTAATHAATKSYVDSAAVGQSGWTDGGANVYLTTTSDNVGIGTTSPSAALTINNGNYTQQRIENDDPGEEAAIRFRSRDAANANYLHADISTYAEGGYLGFKVPHNNTPGTGYRLVIRDNGTVGIGTTSPQSTLHINQGGDISTGFIKGIRLQGLSNSFQISAGVQGVSNTTFGIADVTNSIYRLVIESGGDVGIGTTNPSYKLEVAGTGSFSQPVIVGSPTAASHAATKSYVDSATVGQSGWTDGGANVYLTTTSDNVGIGTMSPQQKLEVAGSLRLTGDSLYLNGSNAYLRSEGIFSFLTNGGSAQGGRMKGLMLGTSYNQTPDSGELKTSSNENLILDASGSGSILFQTNNSTKLTLTNSGDLSTSMGEGFRLFGDTNYFGSALDGIVFEMQDGNQTLGRTDGGFVFRGYTPTDGISSDWLTIRTPGNVGIGTLSPSYTLDVSGTGRFTQPVIVGTPTAATHATTKSYVDSAVSSGVSGGISGTQNYIAKFGATGNTVGNSQIFDNGTNVGIGTTSPSRKLQVAGNVAFTNSDDSGALLFTSSGSLNSIYSRAGQSSSTALPLAFLMGGTERMRIDTSGNVGIGTTSPIAKLEVNGNAVLRNTLSIYSIEAGQTDRRLSINPNTADTFLIYNYDEGAGTFHDIQLGGTSSIGTGLIAKGNGNVGIGTTSPGYTLDVSGTGRFTQPVLVGTPTAASHAATKSYVDSATVGQSGWTDGGSNVYLTTTSDNVGIGTTSPLAKLHAGTTLSDYSTLSFSTTGALISATSGDQNDAESNVLTLMRDGTSGVVYAGAARFDMSQWANDGVKANTKLDIKLAGDHTNSLTSVLTLQSNGNVGIGTSSPDSILHLNKSGAVLKLDGSSGSGSPYVDIMSDTNEWKLITYGSGSAYSQKFGIVDGSDARMIFDSTGNVGIGTTSPAYKLEVSGTGRFTQPVIVGTPTANDHAATKSYVDSATTGQTGWTDGGTNVYLTTTSDNVGIGTTSPGAKLDVNGIINAATGYKIANTATAGNYLRGNGTNFVSSAIQDTDLSTNIFNLEQTYGYHNYGNSIGNNWYKIAEVTFNGTCQSKKLFGEYEDLGYTTIAKYSFSISGRAECDFTTNNENHHIDWNYQINSTYAANIDSKFRIVRTVTSTNIATYELQVYVNTWDTGAWTFRKEGGWTIYTSPETAGTPLADARVNKLANLNIYGGTLVASTAQFSQPITVGTPTAASHATTKSYVDSAITTGTGSYVLKAGDTMTGTLAFAAGSADRLNMNGNNIIGVNKLTVTTIDPVYEINNKKYATYVSDTIGLKMEHYGKITTRIKEQSSYVSIIDFSKEKEGSDLWLFWQTIDEGDNMKDIIITMTPEDNVNSWYNIIPEKKQIKIFTSSPTTLSYHLVAPRHDSDTWSTHLPADHKEKGTVLELRN